MGRKSKPSKREGITRRPRHVRQIKRRILLSTEGRKTEVEYFGLIQRLERFQEFSFKIDGETSTSDPVDVVRRAAAIANEQRFKDDKFEFAFAVYDGDRASRANQAEQFCNSSAGNGVIPIVSTPCFEFWLLLHFELVDTPYNSCASLLPRLQNYLPGYNKSVHPYFGILEENLDRAISNAEQLADRQAKLGFTNPITAMHKVFRLLI